MRVFLGVGLMAVLVAVAVCSFFGIINANAILHPNVTYQKVRLLVVEDKSIPAVTIKIHPEGGCKNPGVLKIIWSLRHQPEAWSADGFHLKSGKIDVWTANEDYGLKVNGDFPYSDNCRMLLWATFKTWKIDRNNKDTESLIDGRPYSDKDL